MTRDYNNQRRDNVRPFSRNQSSSRHTDEQSPRPARPRLNRETVDRAWQSGAPTHHADYRTRDNYRQASHNNWQTNQQSERSSAQSGRKPYGNRQENNRRFERTPDSSSGPRSRSFDADRRNFDDQRFSDRRTYSDRPRANGAQPDYRDNRRSNEFRSRNNEEHPGYRSNSQSNESRSRNNDQGRSYQRRDAGSFEGQSPNSRRDTRSSRNFDRDSRSSHSSQERNTQNTRWQSRPPARRNNQLPGQRDFVEPVPQREQFKGDYERFDIDQSQQRPSSRRWQHNDSPDAVSSETEERQVTRLPDGRILKGPRSVQRKNTQFWSDISQDTDDLLDGVEIQPVQDLANQPPLETNKATPAKKTTPKVARKLRSRTPSAVARDRKSSASKSPAKPSSKGPKPSQRGFKWPTP